MAAAVVADAHQLAGGTFENRIGRVGVGPFDEHSLADGRAGWLNRRSHRVAGSVETGKMRIVRQRRTGELGVFQMNRVELSVAHVIGIEREADKAVGETGIGGKLVKQAGAAVAAVEIEIGSEFSGRLIEYVQRTVEVIDEPAILRAARLLANEVDAREQTHHLAFAVHRAGHRHGGIVAQVKRDLAGRTGAQTAREGQNEGREPHYDFGPSAITKYSARSGPGFASPCRSFELT